MRKRNLLVTLLALAACGDDDAVVEAPPVVEDAAVATPDGSVESRGIPLVDWVDDLVDHHTDDSSAPDTVDDKKIIDDEDPGHFTRRF
jgi:hypothetical protein